MFVRLPCMQCCADAYKVAVASLASRLGYHLSMHYQSRPMSVFLCCSLSCLPATFTDMLSVCLKDSHVDGLFFLQGRLRYI